MVDTFNDNFVQFPDERDIDYVAPGFYDEEDEVNDPYAEEVLAEAIDPNSISLTSFKPKKKLNGKLWDEDNKMVDTVRAKLLKVANEFWEFCSIDFTAPEDVIMVGSLANYNWSKNSDIDLHLLVDFSKVGDNREFVEEYFKDKKNLWNHEHADIVIHKFPVELYVQDIDEGLESAAVYSLLKNKWIEEPVKDALGTFTNKTSIKKTAASFMDQVDDFEAEYDRTTDFDELQNLELRLMSLITNLRHKRKKALEADGELADDNIVYKILRRAGYIDKLYTLYKTAFNKRLSL